ncbi:MAG: peptidoglycan-binding protein [Oscillospiraceae bacterium]|nr:peptidoglycan-binding protein [Oscillospiraceae bacterium]
MTLLKTQETIRRILVFVLAVIMLFPSALSVPSALDNHDHAALADAPAQLTRNLYQGSVGDDVKVVQQYLKNLGYYTGGVDGSFGAGTYAAVAAFQNRNALYSDGIVGPKTYAKLISGNAIPASSSSVNPNPVAPESTTLLYGSTGSAVLQLQTALKALGYYNGPLSGEFLSQTREAVRLFQSRNDLTADGIAGRITLTVLYSGNARPHSPVYPPAATATPKPTAKPTVYPTRTPNTTPGHRYLKYGMSGDDVATVQSVLYRLGYYTGAINGKYGSSTEAAVRWFQKNNNLWADGIVGPDTWARLLSSTARPPSGGNPTYPIPPVQPTYKPTAAPTYVPPQTTCQGCGAVVVSVNAHKYTNCDHYICKNNWLGEADHRTQSHMNMSSLPYKCPGCGADVSSTDAHKYINCNHYMCNDSWLSESDHRVLRH